jgi:hypothetical protein
MNNAKINEQKIRDILRNYPNTWKELLKLAKEKRSLNELRDYENLNGLRDSLSDPKTQRFFETPRSKTNNLDDPTGNTAVELYFLCDSLLEDYRTDVITILKLWKCIRKWLKNLSCFNLKLITYRYFEGKKAEDVYAALFVSRSVYYAKEKNLIKNLGEFLVKNGQTFIFCEDNDYIDENDF